MGELWEWTKTVASQKTQDNELKDALKLRNAAWVGRYFSLQATPVVDYSCFNDQKIVKSQLPVIFLSTVSS